MMTSFFILFALSLGQFINLTKSMGFNLYLFDIVIAVFVFFSLFHRVKTRVFVIPKSLLLFCVFSIIAVISVTQYIFVLPDTYVYISLSYLARWVFYLLSVVSTYNSLYFDKLSPKTLKKMIIFSGIFLILIGVVQLLLVPDLSVLDSSLGWDPHKNRLYSTFFDPNFLGAYLVLVFSVVLTCSIKYKRLVLVILLTGILLTFSRSAWLMFASFLFLYSFLRSPKVLVYSIGLFLSAYLLVPRVQTRIAGITDPADSAQFRLISWNNTLTIIKDNPWLGVGFNSYRYAQQNYGYISTGTLGGNSGAGSDSSLLFVWATTGALGLIVFLVSYFYPLAHNLASGENSPIAMGLFSLLVEAQFINSLFFPQTLYLWLLLTALLAIENGKVRTKHGKS